MARTSAFVIALAVLSGCDNSGSTISAGGGTPTPSPTINLSANPLSVSGGGTSTLSWSSSNATTCTASGAWSGTKPVSGSQSTGVLNTTGNFSLSCSGAGGSAQTSVTVTVQTPGTGSASLSWVAPTTNEDDSPLTDLAGFNIYRGTSATSLQRIATVAANQLTYTVNNLPVGTHHFAVTATTTAGAESVYSTVGSKTIP